MASKAQTWSMDIMMAIALFVVGILLLYYFVGIRADSARSDTISGEGERLPRLLSSEQSSNLSFIKDNKVDQKQLEQFASLNYNQTKAALGIKSDFCIYFEDENGNLVNISGSQLGVGSGKAKLAGRPCGFQ